MLAISKTCLWVCEDIMSLRAVSRQAVQEGVTKWPEDQSLMALNFFCCRREAVQVWIRGLRPAVREQLRPEEAFTRSHVGQAIQLSGVGLRQELHAPELAAKTYESARLWGRFYRQKSSPWLREWREWFQQLFSCIHQRLGNRWRVCRRGHHVPRPAQPSSSPPPKQRSLRQYSLVHPPTTQSLDLVDIPPTIRTRDHQSIWMVCLSKCHRNANTAE